MATNIHPHHPASSPDLKSRLTAVRALTRNLAAPLSDADATVQSMPDTSPAKWHLAHTTWFLETFVLRDHVPAYQLFDETFGYLFNSYYEAEGARHDRTHRGLLTRPSLDRILEWRAYVDRAVADAQLADEALSLVELGIHHEQQHQELLLTDMLHLLAQNPTGPAMFTTPGSRALVDPSAMHWIVGRDGTVEIGADGGSFGFDCEGPRHTALLTPHALASRLVTNAEWAAFIADGGYADPRHWLADGWVWVQSNAITAPLYWREGDGGWERFTLGGWQPVAPDVPVTHVSLYEADAYASWAEARLPTEFEWEAAAVPLNPASGNQLDIAGAAEPRAATCSGLPALQQMFGDCWEWTGSAFRPYPGFKPCAGAVGEYNGKFMSGQFVLKGGSCATPRGHIRASYRNFFYPHQRWQFTGVRLAKDI